MMDGCWEIKKIDYTHYEGYAWFFFFFCTNWEYLYTCHFPIKEVILARLAELRYNYQPKQSVSLIEIILKHGSRKADAVSNNLATSRSWFSVSALLIFGLGNSWL